MSSFRLVWAGAIGAIALAAGGTQAIAQQPTGQYYGYGSGQAVAPSAQGPIFPGCHGGDKVGCHVVVPPPPCQNAYVPNPGFEYPNCQNAHVIYNEAAPPPPIWVTVYRNHYVPIRIETVAPPKPVQPVNIIVKWREVHYLCDCPPGTTQCPHIPAGATASLQAPVGGSLQAAPAGAPQAAPGGPALTPQGEPQPPAPAPGDSAPPPPADSSTAVPPPATPAFVHQESPPLKRWVYLEKQGVYGYGYQRADGRWVIDPNSKRPTPPPAEMTPAVPTTAANAGMAPAAGA